MTDAYTDILFPKDYPRVVFPVSRLVCDPERFFNDADEPMSQKGMGVIYTHGSHKQLIRNPSQREAIIRKFYEPHHQKLSSIVKERLQQEQTVLIIDCHSFSNIALPYEDDQGEQRPDICIGTDSFHTPVDLLEKTKQYFSSKGYIVEENRPYTGSLVPMEYYRSDNRVSSIMIEINRSLYMDTEGNLGEKYLKLQKDLAEYCNVMQIWGV